MCFCTVFPPILYATVPVRFGPHIQTRQKAFLQIHLFFLRSRLHRLRSDVRCLTSQVGGRRSPSNCNQQYAVASERAYRREFFRIVFLPLTLAAGHTRLSSEWILVAWRVLKRTFYAGPMAELRLTCDAGLPAVQRRVDAVSVSFRKSLETTKSRVQETVLLQGITVCQLWFPSQDYSLTGHGHLFAASRGLAASSETRAEVVELIVQLEAKNPTPAPKEALTFLNGK
ncbi:hypothetical protein DM860_014152 [Cuscuta australis]|uniref:Plastid lipid-associated protein/fibrillin conserved domain-containing protein n=1 Tax=Cuscuta australis TaxID=267555 RepID=A0A328DE03_9ASTE|nr:hypothetical protein DM860_014152 [Cuscuta australis]